MNWRNREDFTMKQTDEPLKHRFSELADKAYTRNINTFTNFLGLMELNVFYDTADAFSFANPQLFGGADFCDRKIIRFGQEDSPYPITCLFITPTQKKFSDELTHRDFLGALLNLGIKREMIGDILVRDKDAYVFCIDSIADFLIKELDRVKHTSVACRLCEDLPDQSFVHFTEQTCHVASLRLDAVISEVCRLSRSQAQAAIHDKKVFIDGRLTENNSTTVKPLNKITVRGFGKFILTDNIRTTKKGRLSISVLIYA